MFLIFNSKFEKRNKIAEKMAKKVEPDRKRFNESWLAEFHFILKLNKKKDNVFCKVFQRDFGICHGKKMT